MCRVGGTRRNTSRPDRDRRPKRLTRRGCDRPQERRQIPSRPNHVGHRRISINMAKRLVPGCIMPDYTTTQKAGFGSADGTTQGPCADGYRLHGWTHCGCPNRNDPWTPDCKPESWVRPEKYVPGDRSAEFTQPTAPVLQQRRFYEAVLGNGAVRTFNGTQFAEFKRFASQNRVERFSVVRFWDPAATTFVADLEQRTRLADISPTVTVEPAVHAVEQTVESASPVTNKKRKR